MQALSLPPTDLQVPEKINMQTLSPPSAEQKLKVSKRKKNPYTKENGSCKRTSKKKRNNAILVKWIEDHSFNPYPTKPEKVYLANQAGMNLRQLDNWFANSRRNIKIQSMEVWLRKHPTHSANPHVLSFIRNYHDSYPYVDQLPAAFPTSYGTNVPAGISTPPPDILSPLPTTSSISSEEGGAERGVGGDVTFTMIDQRSPYSVSNGAIVGYQPPHHKHHMFNSTNILHHTLGATDHPTNAAGGFHSPAIYGTTHLIDHPPSAPRPLKMMVPSQTLMTSQPSVIPPSPSTSSSSYPQYPAYKFSNYPITPQVINTISYCPYAADGLPSPPQILDTQDKVLRADGSLQQYQMYQIIPPRSVKEDGTKPAVNYKLSLYPPDATALTCVNGGGMREEGNLSNGVVAVSGVGGGGVNGRWEVGTGARVKEEMGKEDIHKNRALKKIYVHGLC